MQSNPDESYQRRSQKLCLSEYGDKKACLHLQAAAVAAEAVAVVMGQAATAGPKGTTQRSPPVTCP